MTVKPLHRTTLALALSAWLAACGPGSGGTGTGETGAAFAVFGATAASLCDSRLPDALPCVGGVLSVASSSGAPASSAAYFSDPVQGGKLTATIEGNSAELVDRCRALRFVGDWGITAGNDGRFFGSLTQGNGTTLIASMSVSAATGGNTTDITVVLRDAAGGVLLGPLTLQRITTPAAALGC
jgi:hypothetical protein